jgi:phage recombination protein Bet
MDKSLATTEQRATAALVNWNDPQMQLQIKQTYGKDLNEGEWKLFVGLGVATGLNPFLREIWAVKYGNNPASVFIGRDGYRRSAQNHPEYEYHFADAVYTNDVYKVVSGEVTHEYTLKDRGALVGAYCIVKRKNASKPAVTYVDLKEYVQSFGVWKTKPATMIKKVAEAQGLRASFQELFAGTYEESEQWQEDKKNAVDVAPVQNAPVTEQPAETSRVSPTAIAYNAKNKKEPVEATIVEPEETPPAPAAKTEPVKASKITTEQTRKLYEVWAKYKAACKMPESESAPRRKELMQEMFGVTVSTSLNEEQGDALITRIEEMTAEALL